MGSKTYSVARAQDVPLPGPANGSVSQTQGSQPVRRFDIPAGSLDSALTAFEQAAGYRVSLSQEAMRRLSSPSVSGVYTAEQALQRLLAGTGLTYRFTSATAVFVDLKNVATSVEVTASVSRASSTIPSYRETSV